MPVCTGSELRMDCICRSDAAKLDQWRQTAPAEEAKAERTGMIYGSRIQRESHCSNRAVAFLTPLAGKGERRKRTNAGTVPQGNQRMQNLQLRSDSTDARKREI